MTTISLTDARATLAALISKVQQGDEVTITRHGEAVAVLVNPATLRARRASELFDEARRIHELLEVAPVSVLPPAGLSVQRAEELVGAIRRDRDAADV